MKEFYEKFVILPQEGAESVIEKDEGWNVISICAPDLSTGEGPKPLFSNAKDICRLNFHDFASKNIKFGVFDLPPDEKHIEKSLHFAQSKLGEKLMIHCHAGASRSPAIGFVILLSLLLENKYENPAATAIKEIRKMCPFAFPNRLVIDLGINYLIKDESYKINIYRELYDSLDFNKLYGA